MTSKIKIKINSDDLARLCMKWKVDKLAFFGSVVREDFGPESDIDMVVWFQENSGLSLLDIVDMKEEFEAFFDRDVDIVELEAVTNPFSKKIIDRDMQVVYEK